MFIAWVGLNRTGRLLAIVEQGGNISCYKAISQPESGIASINP